MREGRTGKPRDRVFSRVLSWDWIETSNPEAKGSHSPKAGKNFNGLFTMRYEQSWGIGGFRKRKITSSWAFSCSLEAIPFQIPPYGEVYSDR